MSEELQKDFKIFKGEKVIYRDTSGHLSTRVVEDVVEVSVRTDESFIAVTLEGDDGGYVDFYNVITLEQALDFFDLKVLMGDEWKKVTVDKIKGVIINE